RQWSRRRTDDAGGGGEDREGGGQSLAEAESKTGRAGRRVTSRYRESAASRFSATGSFDGIHSAAEKKRAEVTGAGGSHTSSTFGVRHCWLANIDLASRFVRDSHVMSWTAGDDTGRLYGPGAYPSRSWQCS